MKVVVLAPIKRQASATPRGLPAGGPRSVCRTLPKLISFLVIWISLYTGPVRSQSKQHRAEDAMISPMMGKNSEAMTKPTADNDTKSPASFYEILGKSLKKRKIKI